MAGARQPVDLLLVKGKKNLTKQEIEERRKQEIKAPSDKVKAPSYLPKDLKREFKKIADELKNIGIMTNLDPIQKTVKSRGSKSGQAAAETFDCRWLLSAEIWGRWVLRR